MKKVLVLLFALFIFVFCGCTPDMPSIDETTSSTAAHTYHPENTYAILRTEALRINSLIRDEKGNNLLPFEITYISIDDSNSVILVGIKDINDEKIQHFKENISDADYIVFEEGGNIVLTTE